MLHCLALQDAAMCRSSGPATCLGSPISISIAMDKEEKELTVLRMSNFLPQPCFYQKALLP